MIHQSTSISLQLMTRPGNGSTTKIIWFALALIAGFAGGATAQDGIPSYSGALTAMGENAGGNLSGGVVESLGTARYSIPIVVPPGNAGLQPELALTYTSSSGRGGSGWLGFDWGLAGLSAIERDRKFGPPYDFDNWSCGSAAPCYRDDFVLDGQDLVCEDLSSPCTRFRTQVDGGLRIQFDSGAQKWLVRGRDGRLLTYGSQSATRIVNPKNNQIFSWLLERIEDAHGNWINFEYFQPLYGGQPSGIRLPSQITYSFAGDTGGVRSVIFWRDAQPGSPHPPPRLAPRCQDRLQRWLPAGDEASDRKHRGQGRRPARHAL